MNNLIRTETTFVLDRKMPSVVSYLYNHSYPLKKCPKIYSHYHVEYTSTNFLLLPFY